MAVNLIDRTGAEALIPEEVTKEIIQGAVASSVVLSNFRKLPNMASNVLSMPVLDMLPLAYFVDGDTGRKKTTKMAWDKKKIHAEEIAVIIPIPEAVLNDARDNGYDIWGEVTPRINEAFGKVIDSAILFGDNKPSSWPASIVDQCTSSGNIVASTGKIYDDIMGEGGVIAKVEEDGFMPNGVISSIKMRAKLRGLKDTAGNPLYATSLAAGVQSYSLDGMPMSFPRNGAFDDTKANLIVGDMSQAVYSIRQDVTYKLLTEGVIQDEEGKIVYNLAQQDMVALRVVLRLGWELPNPINALNDNKTTRLPFALYSAKASI